MKHIVEKVKLENGAEGLLIEVPDALVMTFEFNFRAGEYLVEPKKWETPHIMEHMLLGANELYPKARVFQAEFEKNGAYNNASTGVYDITYEAECADFEWERIFDLMLLSISRPLFLQSEFEAELGNVREELSGRANNHFRHLSLAMRRYSGYQAMTDRERGYRSACPLRVSAPTAPDWPHRKAHERRAARWGSWLHPIDSGL